MGVEQIDLSESEKFINYLRSSKYEPAYVYLWNSLEQIRLRKYLLDQAFRDVRQKMSISSTAEKEEIARIMKESHALHFDLLSKVFVLIEDLAYFYHVLNDDPRKIAGAMVETFSVKPGDVVQSWRRAKIGSIKRVFRFPALQGGTIPKENKSFFRELLMNQAKLVQKKLTDVALFWTNYLDVYNVYKHGLSAITGTHAILDGQIVSIVLVRRRRKIGNKTKICTYHLPVDPATTDYLQKVSNDAYDVLKLLVDSCLYFIRNEEGFFVLPIWRDELHLTTEDSRLLDMILKSLPFKAPHKEYAIQIRISPKRAQVMRKFFLRKHIYCNCSFDIFQMTPKIEVSAPLALNENPH